MTTEVRKRAGSRGRSGANNGENREDAPKTVPAAATKTQPELNPVTAPQDMEFFGIPGAIVVTFLIHATVIVIAWGSHENEWPNLNRLLTLATAEGWKDLASNVTLDAAIALAGWWCFHVALHLLIPAETVKGVELRDGTRLDYRINGKKPNARLSLHHGVGARFLCLSC